MRRLAGLSRTSGQARRLSVALVVLAAIMLRGLTPAGWMPNLAGATGGQFVVCTATGPQLAQPSPQGQPAAPQPVKHGEVCAFAGHHAAPGPAPAVAAGPVILVSFATPRPVRRAPPATAASHREQAQRAPPTRI